MPKVAPSWPGVRFLARIMLTLLLRRCTTTTAWIQQAKTFHWPSSWTKNLCHDLRVRPNGLFFIHSSSHHRKPTMRVMRSLTASSRHGNDDDDDSSKNPEPKSQKKKKSNFRVNKKLGEEQMDKLAQAFDELARQEGFTDASWSSYYADDTTFEDEFVDDDYLEEEEGLDISEDVMLDSSDFDLQDFSNQKDNDNVDNAGDDDVFPNDDDDMDARILAAQRDMGMGRVSVPEELDDLANDMTTKDELRRLGFRPEPNPFGDDETPRKDEFVLVTNSMVCSACGANFQCADEKRPGFLNEQKFEVQVKLSKIEEMQKVQDKANADEWSTDDEIDWLLRTSGEEDSDTTENTTHDIDAAEDLGLDLVKLSKKKVICKRCHELQNYGKVDQTLRPGWTNEPLLSQQKFRDLLRPIREKPAVIIALVDLFDFAGSVLPELDNIAGDNPVILAANKADLLPTKMGQQRAEDWVRRELEYMGIQSLANVGGSVRLVSCKTGAGIGAMIEKARKLAEEMDCEIYVVGAANAGKSTLLNRILTSRSEKNSGKRRAGNANQRKGAITTSPLPGTTLEFIKVDLGGGRSLYDTPGLLVPGTITQMLTPEELKIVVPKK